MSETGEQMGRCRREMTAAYESTRYKPSDSEMLIADAIDRLAADVAAIKAKADSVTISLSPEDVAHFVECEKAWVTLVEEQRDAAIRERDAARAEVERLKAARDAANRLYGVEQAKVERLRKELEQRQPAGNSPKASDSSPAAPQPAAPPPGWLTEEERRVLQNHAESLREQRFALERGGQAIGYSVNPGLLKREADLIDAILSRAGSPPVVEVPAISRRDVPMQNEAFAYRDAMDKAGVKWKEKEVGRE